MGFVSSARRAQIQTSSPFSASTLASAVPHAPAPSTAAFDPVCMAGHTTIVTPRSLHRERLYRPPRRTRPRVRRKGYHPPYAFRETPLADFALAVSGPRPRPLAAHRPRLHVLRRERALRRAGAHQRPVQLLAPALHPQHGLERVLPRDDDAQRPAPADGGRAGHRSLLSPALRAEGAPERRPLRRARRLRVRVDRALEEDKLHDVGSGRLRPGLPNPRQLRHLRVLPDAQRAWLELPDEAHRAAGRELSEL